jgi:hypothetical protein
MTPNLDRRPLIPAALDLAAEWALLAAGAAMTAAGVASELRACVADAGDVAAVVELAVRWFVAS